MIDFEPILERLAKRRPIFHSEADFQHELAWETHTAFPNLRIRLEQPFPGRTSGAIDMVLANDSSAHAVELKYLTRLLSVQHEGEEFGLKQHGAQDIRRYDVCRDVERMEEFASAPNRTSSVIVLTNDPYYWETRPSGGTIAEAFSVSEGRALSGELRWASHAGSGTTRNRERPIVLCGSHALTWKDYSDLGGKGRFRYLCVSMSGEAPASDGR